MMEQITGVNLENRQINNYRYKNILSIPLRIKSSGDFYHVNYLSNRCERIIFNDEDRQKMLSNKQVNAGYEEDKSKA
jgi:hypothetical protein